MISIILCTYNHAPYLAQAIESCMAQTFKDFELVVVDDGSTDSTPKLKDYFLNKYSNIRWFEKPNTGLSDSKNYGIERAIGDIICHADADDIQEKNKLSIIAEWLPKGDFLYTGFYHCNSKGEIWETTHPNPFDEAGIRNKGITGESLAMYKKTWAAVPYRSDIRINEDLAWSIDAFKLKLKAVVVDIPTFRYRLLPTGISIAQKKEIEVLTNKLLKELDEKD